VLANNKVDFQATYENVVTSSFLERGFIPIIVDDEKTGLEYALRSCGLADRHNPKIIKIKNTMQLDEIWVSSKVLVEIRQRPNLEITTEVMDLFA
jgi:hypothetical protein